MSSLKSRSSIVLIVLALIAAPALADEQDNVPTREGNTWDWRHHEPNPSVVRRDEDAAGVNLSQAQEEKANGDVESLYRQLMTNKENE
jgi:hypothetical protein